MHLEDKIRLGQEALDYRQAHEEDDAAWRVGFVRQKWGQGLPKQERAQSMGGGVGRRHRSQPLQGIV